MSPGVVYRHCREAGSARTSAMRWRWGSGSDSQHITGHADQAVTYHILGECPRGYHAFLDLNLNSPKSVVQCKALGAAHRV